MKLWEDGKPLEKTKEFNIHEQREIDDEANCILQRVSNISKDAEQCLALIRFLITANWPGIQL